uniref:Uncharacterized protein n=2 Tax=Ciona intestinalis TaxID=7719 RepID=F6Z1V3_CIOIN
MMMFVKVGHKQMKVILKRMMLQTNPQNQFGQLGLRCQLNLKAFTPPLV